MHALLLHQGFFLDRVLKAAHVSHLSATLTLSESAHGTCRQESPGRLRFGTAAYFLELRREGILVRSNRPIEETRLGQASLFSLRQYETILTFGACALRR